MIPTLDNMLSMVCITSELRLFKFYGSTNPIVIVRDASKNLWTAAAAWRSDVMDSDQFAIQGQRAAIVILLKREWSWTDVFDIFYCSAMLLTSQVPFPFSGKVQMCPKSAKFTQWSTLTADGKVTSKWSFARWLDIRFYLQGDPIRLMIEKWDWRSVYT